MTTQRNPDLAPGLIERLPEPGHLRRIESIVREWRRGCSIAPAETAHKCQACTGEAMKAVEAVIIAAANQGAEGLERSKLPGWAPAMRGARFAPADPFLPTTPDEETATGWQILPALLLLLAAVVAAAIAWQRQQ